ncbi:MAG: hypothetical protein L0154_21235 [Chloroflexi bacterium]|nr:hypothetical protein [Chloroflexota bacterium]
MSKVSYEEQILATIVKAFMDTGAAEDATMLAACEISQVKEFEDSREEFSEYGPYVVTFISIYARISGNGKFCDKLEFDNDFRDKLRFFLNRALSDRTYEELTIVSHLSPIEVDMDWRSKLFAEADDGRVHNQNSFGKKSDFYKGMSFNSPPEVSIAKALDAKGVMYLPNCLTRVGAVDDRRNLFPDFLICYQGRWGILEVDGRTYHTGNATDDHNRSRLIERHGGVSYFTRFDAQRCMKDPDGVVQEFLDILANK